MTKFNPTNENLTLHLTTSLFAPANLNPASKPRAPLALLHLLTIFLGMTSAKTRPATLFGLHLFFKCHHPHQLKQFSLPKL